MASTPIVEQRTSSATREISTRLKRTKEKNSRRLIFVLLGYQTLTTLSPPPTGVLGTTGWFCFFPQGHEGSQPPPEVVEVEVDDAFNPPTCSAPKSFQLARVTTGGVEKSRSQETIWLRNHRIGSVGNEEREEERRARERDSRWNKTNRAKHPPNTSKPTTSHWTLLLHRLHLDLHRS